MNTLYIILGIIAILSIIVFIFCHFCFDDQDPDMDWYDTHTESEHPNVAMNTECNHSGEKSLVCEWTICGCEKVNTHCDDCGEIVKHGAVEC